MDLDFSREGGYNRYSTLAQNIIELCNDSNRLEDVIDDDNNVRKHYSLEQGIHVYVSENGTVMISKNEINAVNRDIPNDKRWGQYDVYIKYNDRACKFCIEGDPYLKGIGIEYYADPEYGKDRYFFPHYITGGPTDYSKPMEKQRTSACQEGYIPNHFKLILTRQRIHDVEGTAKDAMNELWELGDQMHMVAEIGYKEACQALDQLMDKCREMGFPREFNGQVELLKLIQGAYEENSKLRDIVTLIALRERDNMNVPFDPR